jgi:Txe/YoeB family toxin of Txe-Axe toxin-antitoxin module
MAVLIATTFFESLNDLEPREAAKAIEFVTKFQANPDQPGIRIEKLQTKSRDVWSGRITQELRCIIHKDGGNWALLHAGHHDPAYQWAQRRAVGRHPVTGALQIVETVESSTEVVAAVEQGPADAKPIFVAHADDYLASLGVPLDWLPTIRKIVDDDQLLQVVGRLPEDVAERLVALAAGDLVTPPPPVQPSTPLAQDADTQRRFYVVEQEDELLRALQAPMERWLAFLHPSQRALVAREFSGPAKVSGSAGTGKTVVAMHRARHLARLGHRVLLTSFVTTLCDNVARSLDVLCSNEERSRIEVSTVHKQALAVVRRVEPDARVASSDDVMTLLDRFAREHAPAFDLEFVRAEWQGVVEIQGIGSWPEYRRARRIGRGQPVSVRDRKTLWAVFGGVQEALRKEHRYDWSGLCGRAAELLASGEVKPRFDAVVVDEVQDLKPPELRFIAALCAHAPGRLMVVGDAGQRIYPGGFSLTSLGIDVRGRSSVLRLNYRTTEQIRRAADRVLGNTADDMDGATETRTGTRSLLRGPVPELVAHESPDAEVEAAVARIRRWLGEGLKPTEIGVFARTRRYLDPLEAALAQAGIASRRLSDQSPPLAPAIQLGTMHRAKGLEFKAVLILGGSADQIPNAFVLSQITDPQDREEAEARERNLLYVAMTRARDELCVSWAGERSGLLV